MRGKHRLETPELLDGPGLSPWELAHNLRDMAFINRYLGVHRAVLAHLGRLLKQRGYPAEVSILDLATGAGDVPLALVGWARRCRLAMKVVALDINDQILSIARDRARSHPGISFLKADILQLPYRPASFDYTLCNTTFHHFSFKEGITILRSMAEVSRYGFIVTDLKRGVLPYLLSLGACYLISRNRMTRADGPRSVLRSYSYSEFCHLAQASGVEGLRLYRHPFLRIAAVMEKKG